MQDLRYVYVVLKTHEKEGVPVPPARASAFALYSNDVDCWTLSFPIRGTLGGIRHCAFIPAGGPYGNRLQAAFSYLFFQCAFQDLSTGCQWHAVDNRKVFRHVID